MNILVVYPYLPYPLDRGTFQRTFHLLKALASEHTVDLIALCENGEGAEHRPVFEEFCREVKVVPFTHPAWPKLGLRRLLDLVPVTIRHWESPQLELTLEKALRERKYDMVHVCDIVMAQYFMTRHREIPLSMDRSRVDLQYQVQSTSIMARSWKDRLLSWENITKMWLYEKRAARRVSLEVLCGPDDKTFVRRYVSRSVPVSVVANGVDLEYFKPDAAAEPDVQAVRPTVLFCGAMDYTPNVDALRWYFGEIHERLRMFVPHLRVQIVGKNPLPEVQAYAKREEVQVCGSVPDVRPYYRGAWLQMVPLRIGGGTRLKIVESLAMGTPVVSTSIGAQGLDLKSDEEILLADTAEVFVQQMYRLLTDPALRERVAVAGCAVARERFSWKGIGHLLAGEYEKRFAPPSRQELLGVSFDPVTMEEAVAGIADMVKERIPSCVATANVDFVVQARKDAQLADILKRAQLVVCDGTPLIWLSRLLGRPLPERVAGSDLVPRLLHEAEGRGWRVYFLGGAPEVLEAAMKNVRARHPRLCIAGAESPAYAPLAQMDNEGICQRIRAARPDLLLVSFGCPKQEKWIDMNAHATGVPVSIGVGATIDFLAGAKRRAPRWMHGLGLEWVFRLFQEPRRLARRYAVGLVVFAWAILRELVSSNHHSCSRP